MRAREHRPQSHGRAMTTSGDNLDLTSWPPAKDSTSRPSANDALTDYRARLALAEEERAERRRLDLDEQRSSANSPAVRIRAWEKVHGLRMPSDAAHPILAVIAADTGLSLSEVRAEQQARRPAAAPVAAPDASPDAAPATAE
jgi:hypothetical protein